uniref:Uncharacterized protein n=1 Tax=viral metagenome TaxID=1070528 RepID=A0A6C0C8U4_9ZZZZ
MNMICKFPANQNLCSNIAFNIQDSLNMICKSLSNQNLCGKVAFNIQDPLNMISKSKSLQYCIQHSRSIEYDMQISSKSKSLR